VFRVANLQQQKLYDGGRPLEVTSENASIDEQLHPFDVTTFHSADEGDRDACRRLPQKEKYYRSTSISRRTDRWRTDHYRSPVGEQNLVEIVWVN